MANPYLMAQDLGSGRVRVSAPEEVLAYLGESGLPIAPVADMTREQLALLRNKAGARGISLGVVPADRALVPHEPGAGEALRLWGTAAAAAATAAAGPGAPLARTAAKAVAHEIKNTYRKDGVLGVYDKVKELGARSDPLQVRKQAKWADLAATREGFKQRRRGPPDPENPDQWHMNDLDSATKLAPGQLGAMARWWSSHKRAERENP